jgi:hypothetical protein
MLHGFFPDFGIVMLQCHHALPVGWAQTGRTLFLSGIIPELGLPRDVTTASTLGS